MPTYEYRLKDGGTVVRVLPVEHRDDYPDRITVPVRVFVCPRGQPSQEQSAMNGLRKVEEQLGTSEFRRRFPFSVEHTRKAWGKSRATDNYG